MDQIDKGEWLLSGTLRSPYGGMLVRFDDGQEFFYNGHRVEGAKLVGVQHKHQVPIHWIERAKSDVD